MARDVPLLKTLPAPRFRYSPVVRSGDDVFFAGMIALNAATGALEAGGPAAETRRILGNMQAALPELGLTLADLLFARIYTTRFDLFGEINQAWEEVFDASVIPPARTSIGVAALPLGATVEIEFAFRRGG